MYSGTLAVDWDHKGLTIIDNGKLLPRQKLGLKELINDCSPGTRIVIETSMNSYFLAERQENMRLAKERGVILDKINSRMTVKMGRKLGLRKKDQTRQIGRGSGKIKGQNSDNEDAEFIYALRDIHPGNRQETPRLGKEYFSSSYNFKRRDPVLKKNLEKEAVSKLKSFDNLTQEERMFFFNKKNEAKPGLAAIFLDGVDIITSLNKGRRDFECLMGLHGNGFPSFRRAHMMRFGFAPFVKQWSGANYKFLSPEKKREAFHIMRKATRTMFHRLRYQNSNTVVKSLP